MDDFNYIANVRLVDRIYVNHLRIVYVRMQHFSDPIPFTCRDVMLIHDLFSFPVVANELMNQLRQGSTLLVGSGGFSLLPV